MNDCFETLAMMFLIRERDARERKDHSAAVAYANAYDWLCYAVEQNDDCLWQFDSYEEATKFLNTHPTPTRLCDLEEWFKN